MEDFNATEDFIEKWSQEKAYKLLPAIIFLTILSLFGVVGNGSTIYFYLFKSKKTSGRYFVLTLAIFDILVCSFSVPAEIVKLQEYGVFDNVLACKLISLISHFATFTAVCVLFAISFDRFRKICRPFGWQLSIFQVRLICGACAVVAMGCAWPSAVLYDLVEESVTISKKVKIEIRTCRLTDKEELMIYATIFTLSLTSVTVLQTIVMFALYIPIAKRIFQSKRFRKRLVVNQMENDGFKAGITANAGNVNHPYNISVVSTTDATATPCSKYREQYGKTLSAGSHTYLASCDQERKNVNNIETEKAKSEPENNGLDNAVSTKGDKCVTENHKERSRAHDGQTMRFTVMMFAITATFVFSYIPCVILSIWNSNNPTAYLDFSPVGLVFYELTYRSFLINSAINPIIYGAYNKDLRKVIFAMFRRKQ